MRRNPRTLFLGLGLCVAVFASVLPLDAPNVADPCSTLATTMSNYGIVEMKRERNHVRPVAKATEFRIVA